MTTPRLRKIAIGSGGTVVVLLLVLALVPLLFKGRIETAARGAINDAVNAEVAWQDIGLTVFRNFPNLTLSIDELTVVGTGTFAGDTLASIDQLRLVLDLPSVVANWRRGAPLLVRELVLREPALRLLVQEDGVANWDIMRASEPAAATDTASALAVSLRQFRIENGSVTMDDRAAGLTSSVSGYDQTLSGDFGSERFLLKTSASAEAVSVRFAGIPYLSRVGVVIEADLDADMAERRFTFRDNKLRLNDLELAFAGSIGLDSSSTMLDLTFEAPSTDFRHIISLIPAIYAQDFAAIETSGTMALGGRLNGVYSETEFPAFALRATVRDGSFKYPDLPLAARDIGLDLSLDNAGGSLDRTVLDLSRFHALIGSNPIDATLRLSTPVSDPDVALTLAGKVDLAEVRRTMKLDGVEDLAGVISADAAIATRLSSLDRGQFDQVNARGTIDIRNFTLTSADFPHAIVIDETLLRLTPRLTELAAFRGRIGGSDMAMTGTLDNLLRFVMRGEPLHGRATFRSVKFDLNEWQSSNDTLSIIPVPANLDLVLDAEIATLVWERLNLTDVAGTIRVKDQRVTMDGLRMKGLGGTLAMTGYYETVDPARPTFDATMKLTELQIPAAFQALTTIQRFAPIAEFARGTFSAQLGIQGALGEQMMPILSALSGQGALQTSQVAIEGFPALDALAGKLKLPQFTNPTFRAIQSTFAIRDGRLHVQPFDVELGEFKLNVSGSNGIDQSLEYALRLQAPSGLIGAEAGQAISGMLTQAGKVGLNLGAADLMQVGLALGGTVAKPTIGIGTGGTVGGARDAIGQAAAGQVQSLERQADAGVEAARQRARTEADSLVADAERRAEAIRAEARQVAERVRAEGAQAADSLVAKASGPIAKAGAEVAAKRLRREADTRATQIEREADERAEALVSAARRGVAGEP
jgi:hypothetical protein